MIKKPAPSSRKSSLAIIDLGPDVIKPVAKTKEEFRYAIGTSTLGYILVALSAFGIVAVLVSDDPVKLPGRLQERFRKNAIRDDHKGVKATLKRVIHYIDHPTKDDIGIPLDIRGTRFQMRVWNAVRKIGFGKTSTYTDIARDIHAVRAVRAVGSSCTRNLFFIVVPCHRVLRKDDKAESGFIKASPRQRMLISREK